MTGIRSFAQRSRGRRRGRAGEACAWAASLLVLFVAAGCGDVSVTEVDVASVDVEPGTATLVPAQTLDLSAIPRDASGVALPSRPTEWTSLNPDVATVNGAGVVEARENGTARIRATVEGISGEATITVDPSPRIGIASEEVVFEGVAGGGVTSEREVAVTNEGGGSLAGLEVATEYTGSGASGWLQAVLDGSSAPSVVRLRADPGDLPAGTHEAVVRVDASAASNGPRTIEVRFEVAEPGAVVEVSPGAVGFSSSEGQSVPGPQTVDVRNAGGGALTGLALELTYATGSPTGWLTAELSSSSAPAQVVLRADPTGLAPGVFDAEVRVTSPDAPGSTGVIRVRYRYGDPPPQFEIEPQEVERTMEQNGTVPSPATVNVGNAGSGTLAGIGVEVEFSGSASGWLEATLASSQAPTTLRLTFSDPGLEPGVHEASVVLRSTDAINSPDTLPVRLRVETRPSAETSAITANPETILADGLSTSTITVQLRDPQGRALTSGGHDVGIFTSAGSLSSVTDLDDGRYRATLTSTSSPGNAHVTAAVEGEQLSESVTVRFRNRAPVIDLEESGVTATPGSIRVLQSSTIRVQLRDSDGNDLDISGESIVLESSQGSVSPESGETSNGTFEASFSSVSPGSATITAWLGEEPGDEEIGSVTVTVTLFGEADAEESEATIESGTMTTTESTVFRVQLRNSSGENLTSGGDPIFVSTDLGRMDPVRGTTDEEGRFESVFTSDEPGTATVVAYLGEDADGEEIGRASIAVEGAEEEDAVPDAGQSVLTASTNRIRGDEAVILRVQLRDAGGNDLALSGVPIYMEAFRGSHVLGEFSPQSGTTTDGVFESSFTSSETGSTTIRAYLGEDADSPVIGEVTIGVNPSELLLTTSGEDPAGTNEGDRR